MEREPFSIEKINELLSNYSKDSIIISPHYEEHINKGKRDLNFDNLKEYLLTKKPSFVEKQIIKNETRYKIIYNLSTKYDLIIVITKVPQALKVITSYKTSKRIKKLWKKKSNTAMRK